MTVLGIDLGTTGVRIAVVDSAGDIVTTLSSPIMLEASGSRAEIEANDVLAAVESLIRSLPEATAAPIQAISFSTQGEAVLPVDATGNAIAPVPISMDGRGIAAHARISEVIGAARLQSITGQPSHPMFSIYKIAGSPSWHDRRVHRYVTLDGYIANQMGAAPMIDYSMAARTGAYDLTRLDWSDEILSAAQQAGATGIDRSTLPIAVAAGTQIGEVDTRTANRTGLRSGTRIVAGAHDQAAGYLGGSVNGSSVFSFGSSDCLAVATPERAHGLDGTGFATYPLSDELWITLAGTAAGGWALEWLAELVDAPLASVFDDPSPEPSSLIVVPYFAGSGTLDNDAAARGVIAGLTLRHKRPHLARAFLEASAFELSRIIEALESSGTTPGSVTAIGSGSQNRTALEIRATALGRPLTAGPSYASVRGAALIAAVGIGLLESLDQLPSPKETVTAPPVLAHAGWYAKQRKIYRELARVTNPISHSIANLKEQS